MDKLRYCLVGALVLLVLSCQEDSPVEPKRPEPNNPKVEEVPLLDIDKPFRSWAQASRLGKEKELDETHLREWLQEGLAQTNLHLPPTPDPLPDYWASPLRYAGVLYPQKGFGLQSKSKTQSLLRKDLTVDDLKGMRATRALSYGGETSYRSYRYLGEYMTFVTHRDAYYDYHVWVDKYYLMKLCDRPVMRGYLYGNSIRDFLDSYGARVLTGYDMGMQTELRCCRVPAILEQKRGQDATLHRLLSILDEAMPSHLDRDGSRLYYSFVVSGKEQPELTPKDIIERWQENSRFQQWLSGLRGKAKSIIAGSERFGNIASFVEEDNFKWLIEGELSGEHKTQPLQKPYIEIGRVEVAEFEGKPFYDLVPVLYTRHGTKVLLGDVLDPNRFVIYGDTAKDGAEYASSVSRYMRNSNTYTERLRLLAERCRRHFDCEIRTKAYDEPVLFRLPEDDWIEAGYYLFPLYTHNDEAVEVRLYVEDKRVALNNRRSRVTLNLFRSPDFENLEESYGLSAWLPTLPKAERRGGITLVGL